MEIREGIFLLVVSCLAIVLLTLGSVIIKGNFDLGYYFPFLAVLSVIVFAALSYNSNLIPQRFYFASFAMALMISGSILAGLAIGTFESVVLLEDSYIDLSDCMAFLHIKNTGITDLTLAKVQLGDLPYQMLHHPTIARGESKYLVIYYARNCCAWTNELKYVGKDDYCYLVCTSSEKATPLTFENGSSYPTVVFTRGVLQHSVNLDARVTHDEMLDLKVTPWFVQQTEDSYDFQFGFYFHNISYDLSFYVYSIDIGGTTFLLSPPELIVPVDALQDEAVESFAISVHWEQNRSYFGWTGFWHTRDISAFPPINSTTFQMGETYDVTIRTMTNQNYTATITLNP